MELQNNPVYDYIDSEKPSATTKVLNTEKDFTCTPPSNGKQEQEGAKCIVRVVVALALMAVTALIISLVALGFTFRFSQSPGGKFY